MEKEEEESGEGKKETERGGIKGVSKEGKGRK